MAMLIEFEDDMPVKSIVSQFVEPDEDFLARVEEYVKVRHKYIKGVVRIEDESGRVEALVDKLFKEYEIAQ